MIFDIQWTPGSRKIELSSLAPKHVINLGELQEKLSYRLIVNHRSDPSIRTKLSDFIFGIIAASSSCSASFFTDITGLVMYSI
jgi:hypothetical protein